VLRRRARFVAGAAPLDGRITARRHRRQCLDGEATSLVDRKHTMAAQRHATGLLEESLYCTMYVRTPRDETRTPNPRNSPSHSQPSPCRGGRSASTARLVSREG